MNSAPMVGFRAGDPAPEEAAPRPLRVGLYGWNGHRNVGDDAMTSVLIHEVSRLTRGAAEIKLLADHETLPHVTPLSTGVQVSGYRGLNGLRYIPVGRVRLKVRQLMYDRRFARELDVLIIGGGSILRIARNIAPIGWLVRTSRKHNPSLVAGALGVSIGPFRSEKAPLECRRLLASLDFVGVRDNESWELLKGLGVDVPARRGVDLAVLLPEFVPNLLEARPRKTIGVSLTEGVLSDSQERGLAAELARLLATRPDLDLLLFVFCADPDSGDEALTTRFARRIGYAAPRVKIHPYRSNPADFYSSISRCRAVLAMRLHAAVIAYAVETPFVMMAYHPKCVAFATEIGLAGEDRFDARSADPAAVVRRLETFAHSVDHSRVGVSLEAAKRSARGGLSLLGEALAPRSITRGRYERP